MCDRADLAAEEKIRFTSSILPKWARRTKSLDALLPILYLRGVSTGDFQEALAALLGKDAPNLSPAVIARLTAKWQADYDAWQKRDLSARRGFRVVSHPVHNAFHWLFLFACNCRRRMLLLGSDIALLPLQLPLPVPMPNGPKP